MSYIAAIYGFVCYVIFLGSFLYAIGFIGNFFVPKAVDSNPGEPFAPWSGTSLRPH